jgi:azurin
VLRYWRDEVDGALALFNRQVNDPHPRVRLEAVTALSFYDSKDAAEAALEALNSPVDSYLDYGLRETLKSLEEAWTSALFAGEPLAEDTPYGVRYALEQVDTSTLVENVSDSAHPAVYREVLSRGDIPSEAQSTALEGWARAHGTSETEALITLLGTLRDDSEGLESLSGLLIDRGGDELASHREPLRSLAVGGESRIARQAGFAALLTAEETGGSAWRLAATSRRGLNDALNAVPRVDSATRASLYDRVRPLVDRLPSPLEAQAVAADDVEIAFREEGAEASPPRVALFDESGSLRSGELTAEGTGPGTWRANWEEGHRLIVDLPEDAPRQLDAYEVRVRKEDGQIVFASIPRRAHHRSRNLEHGTVTKGPMGNHPKPPLRGQSEIPTADTIAVGGTVAPETVRKSAMRALASMPVNHAETFRALADQAVEGQFFYEAARGINQVSPSRWPTEDLEGLGQDILARAQEIPLEERGSDAFGEVVQLGLSLASRLPDAERETLEDRLDDLVTIITIEAVPGEMRYDKTEFRVPAGRPVVITFRNPDALDHNLVIAEPGHMEEVGRMANDMAGTPDAYERDFIPDTEHVLWYTDLIGADRQDQVSFVAPDDPGDYPYLCTFPNHWRTMKGTMTVTNEISDAR